MTALRSLLCLLLLGAALPAALAQTATSSQPVRAITPAQLLAELRQGGYVLYFRHVATDFSQNDENMRDFDDCTRQRNLLDRGRADARRVGAVIRKLDIPIGRVVASPYCRTVETAHLLFGRAEKLQEARGGPLASDDPQRYAALRRLMSTRPAQGNLVISSHGNPFQAVAGSPYLSEGEMAMIKPLGDRFEITARLRLEDWALLAATSTRQPAGNPRQTPPSVR
jgi:phosphohistidine phosphatase SixA